MKKTSCRFKIKYFKRKRVLGALKYGILKPGLADKVQYFICSNAAGIKKTAG